MKQLTPDPWHTVAEKYAVGSRVQGKVISLMDYGAFVELESGYRRVDSHLRNVVDPQDRSSRRKFSKSARRSKWWFSIVDPGHRRISLGLKQIMA
jgi:small subunit ribosomal protein S1